MKTKTINLYQFDELSDTAKEKALRWGADLNVDFDWWEFVYEDATTIGKILGIDISKIYFSGFYSQGDGACFEGRYSYQKGAVKAVKEYAPNNVELHRIAHALQDTQKKAFYSITANVKHVGRYSHKYSTEMNVEMAENIKQETFTELETAITETLRDFMEWIYRTLNREYDYLTSDEAVIETIISNEYDFDIDGNRA